MAKDQIKLVAIGGSAGSLDAIFRILPLLKPSASFAVIIILHRKPGASGEELLVELLRARTDWVVQEAEEKEVLMPGHIYVAPPDYHLLIETDHTLSLDVSEKVNYSRPSIDVTFESAAEVFGPHLLAILLSGANADGTEGMMHVKEKGGCCIAQAPSSAEVSYMPQQAIDRVKVDAVLDVEQIATFMNDLV